MVMSAWGVLFVLCDGTCRISEQWGGICVDAYRPRARPKSEMILRRRLRELPTDILSRRFSSGRGMNQPVFEGACDGAVRNVWSVMEYVS